MSGDCPELRAEEVGNTFCAKSDLSLKIRRNQMANDKSSKPQEPLRLRGKMPREEREDGRKQHLAYLRPEVILDVKRLSVEVDVPNYMVVEAALKWALPIMLANAKRDRSAWNLLGHEEKPKVSNAIPAAVRD